MASSSKPTGSDFFLIFTCLAILGLGVWVYLEHSWRTEQIAKLTAAETEQTKTSSALNTSVQDMQDALKLIGAQQTIWPEARDTLAKAIQANGVDQTKQTVIATMESLRAAVDAANQENQTVKQDLQKTQDDMRVLQAKYQGRVDEHDQSQQNSEALVQKMAAQKDEELQGRDRQIEQLKEDVRREQVAKTQAIDELNRTEKKLGDQVNSLSMIVDEQRERIEDMMKTSFEVPDGQIVYVDNNLHTVYLNVGQEDNLRPQVSFSVYSQNNHGIGREARDIKARVEVTRLMGPHLAEAKILDQDQTRPIADGDPIYSPVWQGGRSEYFAFVGTIDFDNDGRSDRDTLHRILNSAHAIADVEINDNGERVPADGKITSNTKFLVYGDIPDPSKFASGDEKRIVATRVMDERNALMAEARAAGVRAVRLADFLAYMGYKPQQRFYVPGQSAGFKLQNGARDQTKTSDASTGQTSELFKRARQRDENQGSPFNK